MKLLRQLLIILSIYFIGEAIQKIFQIPIPGSVTGMLILFICLTTGIIKLQMVEEITKFLLDHLAIFFIPSCVGLLAYMGILKANLIAILSISAISTILVVIVTGYTVQMFKGGKKQ